MLEPRELKKEDGIIIEFKVQDTEEEPELVDTVRAALRQIEEKRYEAILTEKAFQGTKYENTDSPSVGKPY